MRVKLNIHFKHKNYRNCKYVVVYRNNDLSLTKTRRFTNMIEIFH